MIIPVNTDVYKAENVTENLWKKIDQGIPIMAFRQLEFQHHNGNDNGQYPVTEGFHPICFHQDPSFPMRVLFSL
ncbi:hypothetical protein GCM10008933_39000 [Paenibacillus motobuensis]|uniref:Uncharacterized protein n=1 Tax=Paenibacillus motobuensis TaxID=295324 RepID=A0ABN0YPZ7_9BACL